MNGNPRVKISAKTEYACIAVLELAARYGSGEPVRVREIADRHGIPSRFLVQILLQLKGAGFVGSTRGAAGGYQLVKGPDEITLGDVMEVIEGANSAPLASNTKSDSINVRVLLDTWNEIGQHRLEALRSITFADLVEQASDKTQNMYYI